MKRSLCLELCNPTRGRRQVDVIMSSVVLYQYVIVGEERYVHVWSSVDTMQFLCTISLHSTAGFPLAISQTRNFIATASTIHTAIKVLAVVVVVVVVVVVAVVVAAAAVAVAAVAVVAVAVVAAAVAVVVVLVVVALYQQWQYRCEMRNVVWRQWGKSAR